MPERAANTFVELRDVNGRLLARYDPERRLLEIRRQHRVVLFDLQQYEGDSIAAAQPTAGS